MAKINREPLAGHLERSPSVGFHIGTEIQFVVLCAGGPELELRRSSRNGARSSWRYGTGVGEHHNTGSIWDRRIYWRTRIAGSRSRCTGHAGNLVADRFNGHRVAVLDPQQFDALLIGIHQHFQIAAFEGYFIALDIDIPIAGEKPQAL